jgi:hypothetical protein
LLLSKKKKQRQRRCGVVHKTGNEAIHTVTTVNSTTMTNINTYPAPLPPPQQQQQQQPSFYKNYPPMSSIMVDKKNSFLLGATTQPYHVDNMSLHRLAASGRKRWNSSCSGGLPIKAKKSLVKAALSSLTRSQQSCFGFTTRMPGEIQTSTAQKPKKSVTFSTIACVSMRPISRQELDATWIQPEEYSEIERERRRSIHAIKATQGDLSRLDASEYCAKGLEHQLSSSRQLLSRKLKNMQYKKLLLEEQNMQRHFGVSDPEALQRLSQLFSEQASKRAHFRACLDSATVSI